MLFRRLLGETAEEKCHVYELWDVHRDVTLYVMSDKAYSPHEIARKAIEIRPAKYKYLTVEVIEGTGLHDESWVSIATTYWAPVAFRHEVEKAPNATEVLNRLVPVRRKTIVVHSLGDYGEFRSNVLRGLEEAERKYGIHKEGARVITIYDPEAEMDILYAQVTLRSEIDFNTKMEVMAECFDVPEETLDNEKFLYDNGCEGLTSSLPSTWCERVGRAWNCYNARLVEVVA